MQNKNEYADIAQEVECVLGKDEVTGSNPVISSTETALESHFSMRFLLLVIGAYFKLFF